MVAARELRRTTSRSSDLLERSPPGLLVGRLQRARSRLTNQRSIAARHIAKKIEAFTSAMLVEELRPLGVSRSTVYRTLKLLERLAALAPVTVDGRAGYVVCDAADGHYHLTCAGCFSVVHVDLAVIHSELERLASEQRHFQVRTHRVEVSGRCWACSHSG